MKLRLIEVTLLLIPSSENPIMLSKALSAIYSLHERIERFYRNNKRIFIIIYILSRFVILPVIAIFWEHYFEDEFNYHRPWDVKLVVPGFY